MCLAGAAVPVGAQPSTPDAVIQEGLRRQEERSREQRDQLRRQPDVLQAPLPRLPPNALEAEVPCFVIQEVRLEGAQWERFGFLQSFALPHLRRCLGVRGLGRVAADMDAELLQRGFATTRVSLPQQNLQSGILRIRVHAGRIAGVRMVAPAGPDGVHERDDARWGTWRNAFPLLAGEVLNIRDLEQGVEQMKRLPSQAVATRLEPGAEPDTTVVVIERKAAGWRDRIRGGATVDNSGGQALGRAQFSGNLALDNPLGLSDLLSASLNSNLQNAGATHRSQSVGLNYSVPWGYSTLTLGANHNRFAQYVQGTTVRFLSSGESDSADARLARTIWRGSSAKLSASAGVSVRRAQSYIDDVELVVQRRRTTNAEFGLAWRQLFGQSSLDLETGLRRGLAWNAQEDLVTAESGGATLRPTVLTYSAGYSGTFNTPAWAGGKVAQFVSVLRGQFTRDTTLSVDQFAIGGRSSVRGFDGDTALLAENGFAWRNDVVVPVGLIDGLETALTLGIDVGRVWGPSDVLLAGRTLAGAALGLRGRAGPLLFDFSLGVPLYRPSNFQTRPVALYASLTYSF